MRMPITYLTFYREYLKHLRYVVINVGMLLFGTVIVYLIYVFVFIYMNNVLQYTVHQALCINIISLIFLICLEPCMGKLSDHIGRCPVMLSAIIGSMIWVWPYFWLLQQYNIALALLAQLVMTLFIAAYRAASGIAMVEIVPVHIRFSVVALAYAIAASIFGGITPLIGTLLIKTTHSYFGLALGISVCALVSLFAVNKVRKMQHVPR